MQSVLVTSGAWRARETRREWLHKDTGCRGRLVAMLKRGHPCQRVPYSAVAVDEAELVPIGHCGHDFDQSVGSWKRLSEFATCGRHVSGQLFNLNLVVQFCSRIDRFDPNKASWKRCMRRTKFDLLKGASSAVLCPLLASYGLQHGRAKPKPGQKAAASIIKIVAVLLEYATKNNDNEARLLHTQTRSGLVRPGMDYTEGVGLGDVQ
eukprot:357260-Chlamydomonas_euryale.AAC.4